MNQRFLRACFREPVDRTPIWIMRQAGRYLPQYRAVRQQYSFLEMCKTPAVAAEVTVQPVEYLDVDAAILFSDILIVPEAMGLALEFKKDHGPKFARPVRTSGDIAALRIPEPRKHTAFVLDAIHEVQSRLAGRVPLIGFAGAPFTVASYMVEGEGSEDYANIKRLAWEYPRAFETLLAKVTDATIAYVNAQIEAGADAVQLFDTWAGQLPEHTYKEQVFPHVQRLLASLVRSCRGRRIATIYFAKGAGIWFDSLLTSGADVIGIDWTHDLGRARAMAAGRVALQGNLDPVALLLPPERIRAEAARVLASYGSGPGHIFNLGHGITPDVPPEHAKVLVDAVHELSAAYHTGKEGAA